MDPSLDPDASGRNSKFAIGCALSFSLAFLFDVETRQVHIGRARDLDIALGAEHDVYIVPEPLDQTRFVRGGYAVTPGPLERLLQQLCRKSLRGLRQHDQ